METSSPARVAGAIAREVQLGERTLLLSQPHKVGRAKDEESFILYRRLDGLSIIAAKLATLPEDQQRAWRRDWISVMGIGYSSDLERAAHYTSIWSDAFSLWCALDPKHKSRDVPGRDGKPKAVALTLYEGVEWCRDMLADDKVTQEQRDSLWEAVRIVSQEDALGE